MKEDWKFFVIELTYLIPFEDMGEIIPEHRAFLQSGYEQGWILVSGPQLPKIGGIIIAKGPSREALVSLFSHDPLQVRKAASYRFIEFDPVRRQGLLEEWVNQ